MRLLLLVPLFAIVFGCTGANHPVSGMHSIQCDTVWACLTAADDTCDHKPFSICSPKGFLKIKAQEGQNRTILVQCRSEQTNGECQ